MPPKRKQPDTATTTEASSTRATRSSTRANGKDEKAAEPVKEKAPAKRKAPAKKKAASPSDGDEEDSVQEPPPKKAKTKAAAKAKPRTKKAAQAAKDDEQAIQVDEQPGPSKPIPAVVTLPEPKKQSTVKAEPYSPAKALGLFTTYADADTPDVIGPEGLEQICTEAEIPMEGALPILLSWQLDAKEMGKFEKSDWIKWTSARKISSLTTIKLALDELNDLLIDGKPPVKKPGKKTDEPYDRTEYWQYAENPKNAFHKLYFYSFILVKPPQSRNIEMDTAKAFWTVLLTPKYILMNEVLEFISGREDTYKAVNKDLWGMMLEFCETMGPNLDGYEADGAWPTLLDEFVAQKKGGSKSE